MRSELASSSAFHHYKALLNFPSEEEIFKPQDKVQKAMRNNDLQGFTLTMAGQHH